MASRKDVDVTAILSGRESNGDVEMKVREEAAPQRVGCLRSVQGNGPQVHQEVGVRGAAPATSSGLDSGWAWIVVLGSFIIHHNVLGLQYSFGVLFKALLDDPEMSKGSSHAGSASVGVISTCMMLGFSVFVGPLVTKYGGGVVTGCGSILVTVGLYMASFAKSVTTLYFTYSLVAGMGFSLLFAPCVMVVSRWFTVKRTIAVGVSVSGSGIGTLVLAQVSERLIDAYGWRGALQYLAVGTGLLNLTAAWIFMTPPPPIPTTPTKDPPRAEVGHSRKASGLGGDGGSLLDDDACAQAADEADDAGARVNKDQSATAGKEGDCRVTGGGAGDGTGAASGGGVENEGGLVIPGNKGGSNVMVEIVTSGDGRSGEGVGECAAGEAEATTATRGRKPLTMTELSRLPVFVPLFGLNLFFSGCMWVPYVYLPAFQFDALGTPLKVGAQNVASIGIYSTLGRLLIGRVAMRMSCLRCLQACCFTAGGSVLLLAFAPHLPWLVWVFSFLFGLTAGSTIALVGPLIIELVGLENLPNMFGLLMSVQAPGVLAIPAVCGFLYDSFGQSYVPVWVLASFGMMGASSLLWLIKKKPPGGHAIFDQEQGACHI